MAKACVERPLEDLRATLDGDAARSIDDAIRLLREQLATQQRMEAGDGGLLINSTQTIVQGDQHTYAPPPDPNLPLREHALIDYLSRLLLSFVGAFRCSISLGC